MVHIFNSSSKEAGASGESEFKASLMYIWDNKTLSYTHKKVITFEGYTVM